jgi:hypothetical protein
MQRLSQLVTSKKERVPTSNKLTSLEIKVRVLTIAEGLTSTEWPNDMTGWYIQAYKALGESKFQMIADDARKPGITYPKRVFGKNLSTEMKAWRSKQSASATK